MKSDHAKESTITEVINGPVDDPGIEDKKAGKSEPVLDYAGSAEKTDPKEIKLVRKLDLWMLVRTEPRSRDHFEFAVSSLINVPVEVAYALVPQFLESSTTPGHCCCPIGWLEY